VKTPSDFWLLTLLEFGDFPPSERIGLPLPVRMTAHTTHAGVIGGGGDAGSIVNARRCQVIPALSFYINPLASDIAPGLFLLVPGEGLEPRPTVYKLVASAFCDVTSHNVA